MNATEAANTLKFVADDHPCCSVALAPIIGWLSCVGRMEAVNQEVERWLAMSADEMRLHAGELTPSEVLLVRAVLRAILAKGLDTASNH